MKFLKQTIFFSFLLAKSRPINRNTSECFGIWRKTNYSMTLSYFIHNLSILLIVLVIFRNLEQFTHPLSGGSTLKLRNSIWVMMVMPSTRLRSVEFFLLVCSAEDREIFCRIVPFLRFKKIIDVSSIVSKEIIVWSVGLRPILLSCVGVIWKCIKLTREI